MVTRGSSIVYSPSATADRLQQFPLHQAEPYIYEDRMVSGTSAIITMQVMISLLYGDVCFPFLCTVQRITLTPRVINAPPENSAISSSGR